EGVMATLVGTPRSPVLTAVGIAPSGTSARGRRRPRPPAITQGEGRPRSRGQAVLPRFRASVARMASSATTGAPDYVLVLTIIGLLAFGLIMVYSASVVTAYTTYRNQYFFLMKQSFAAVLGLVAMAILARIDYHRLRVVSVPGLVASVVLLAIVLVPGLGTQAYGAQRWISLPGFQLQPSEFAKVALAIYMAHWLSTKREEIQHVAYGLVPFTVLLGIIVGLLMKQPDMGTTSVIVAMAFAIFFAAGAHIGQMLGLVGLAVAIAVPLIQHAPYRMERIIAFMDPWARPAATSYHVVQSLLAFGAGGITGVGLGVGRQKFMYLPFPHTDSIFAVIGEELGLLGTVSLVIAFMVFAYRGMRVAWYAPDQFGRLLAVGVTSGITFQALINMAVLTSSVPFTGITLPLISYGGSSLLTTLAACGILIIVSRHASFPQSHTSTGGHLRWWHRRPHLSRSRSRQRATAATST
ncbi:MAG TPA: putative lipid II flippase FtsW, partial [Chloroflexota bacterium]|nr:putative lipid II flippase FtsW [Chloroflexota bacterium]